MAAADARDATSLVVARELVLAAQVVVMVVAVLSAFTDFPWAAAAAPSIVRVTASFSVPPGVGFVAVNVIVIVLAALFRWDAAASSSSADPSGPPSSINGDAQKNPLLELLEGEPPSGEENAPPEEVFEDKEVVHVKTTVRAQAQPPRRTMSEKTGGGAGAAAGQKASAAAAPELRRAKSENGRRRQRRSAVAAAAAAPATVELGMNDGEAFRQVVEAFIAKQQTWFHREESLIARAAAAARGEDGAPAVAVK